MGRLEKRALQMAHWCNHCIGRLSPFMGRQPLAPDTLCRVHSASPGHQSLRTASEYPPEHAPGDARPGTHVIFEWHRDRVVHTYTALQIASQIHGKNATLQEDGWTGLGQKGVMSFMVVVDGKPYTVKTLDVSGERKTAAHLYTEMNKIVLELEGERYEIAVAAIVADAAGESRKARKKYGRTHPWVIILDCFAHQVG